ncbi:cytochrome-c peroxidase [Flavobacterium tructae]|uniref:Methylamine utilization protein MauG n=1 Tax=Flavobacterium tructae TaxID=1114873 RepID=A0A1S1J4W1_9FLAO|nr:cytochrome c peroxidase [Flavobacterium tructae]OHT44226.1 cytochrome-c peroxidase [Flavobacterium tructae]OXB20138.1 cytochrome-c peroxidase [Flavobacterium tructae]
MKSLLLKTSFSIFFIGIIYVLLSFSAAFGEKLANSNWREIYSKPTSQWPKPTIDDGVQWQEFEALAIDTSYYNTMENPKVILGQLLFFDPKLSGSNQVSCSSCHDPELAWGDAREVSLGNDHLQGKRNTPSLYNIGARKSFFWDGRAATLEEQAQGPITAHHEMNMEPKNLAKKLRKIKGYPVLFQNAYGDSEITYEKILQSLAVFQKTILSKRSRFDAFMDGDYTQLSDQEIYGLHLFRTKARCMNCHSGKYLTDESFHNIGLTYYKREYEDLGLYTVTKKADDVGKFRTPSLRDVMYTGPWMHNGLFDNITGIVNMYNSGMHMIDPNETEKIADPLFPKTDVLMQPLNLNDDEIVALVSFIKTLSGRQYKMERPQIPR